jgi:hypothetical protein
LKIISLVKKQKPCKRLLTSVVPIGFEPMAAGLENLCSIQLSYGTGMINESANLRKEII